jgi:hypothetical protein
MSKSLVLLLLFTVGVLCTDMHPIEAGTFKLKMQDFPGEGKTITK